jgi:hypothetical protein
MATSLVEVTLHVRLDRISKGQAGTIGMRGKAFHYSDNNTSSRRDVFSSLNLCLFYKLYSAYQHNDQSTGNTD